MALDTVTLALSGEVSLALFANAVKRFVALVEGIAADAAASDVKWVVDELSAGSLLAVARGIGATEKVERCVRTYGEVGVALERGDPLMRFSPRIRTAAYALRRIPGGEVDHVRLETPEREAIIRRDTGRRVGRAGLVRVTQPPLDTGIRPATAAFGAIEGRVQTLSNRGGLRFTLYDTLNDKAVSCYLADGHEDVMRDAWGRRAVVEGWVSRDPMSGRPLAVRKVKNVAIVSEREPGSYRDARGVSPSVTGLTPEQAIRRLRDA
jgi:hypothetical protein